MTMERWRPTRGLTPWSPFRELEEMERRFDEVFGRSFLPSIWSRLPVEKMNWAPAIDIFEKGDKLVVKAEVPGMKEDDIAAPENCPRLRATDEADDPLMPWQVFGDKHMPVDIPGQPSSESGLNSSCQLGGKDVGEHYTSTLAPTKFYENDSRENTQLGSGEFGNAATSYRPWHTHCAVSRAAVRT